MKFSLEATDANQIVSYDEKELIISPDKNSYPIGVGTSLIVTPDQIITESKISDITDLSSQNSEYLQNLEPEIVIFTTGSSVQYPISKEIIELSTKSIGVECMTLGAACRTFNLLVLEGRRIILVIALI